MRNRLATSGGWPRGSGSTAPVSSHSRLQRRPMADDNFRRAAVVRPLEPSWIASRNRARSADGTGAVIRLSPGKIESHRRQVGKPAILVSNSPL